MASGSRVQRCLVECRGGGTQVWIFDPRENETIRYSMNFVVKCLFTQFLNRLIQTCMPGGGRSERGRRSWKYRRATPAHLWYSTDPYIDELVRKRWFGTSWLRCSSSDEFTCRETSTPIQALCRSQIHDISKATAHHLPYGGARIVCS
jgi:hypothetical protein